MADAGEVIAHFIVEVSDKALDALKDKIAGLGGMSMGGDCAEVGDCADNIASATTAAEKLAAAQTQVAGTSEGVRQGIAQMTAYMDQAHASMNQVAQRGADITTALLGMDNQVGIAGASMDEMQRSIEDAGNAAVAAYPQIAQVSPMLQAMREDAEQAAKGFTTISEEAAGPPLAIAETAQSLDSLRGVLGAFTGESEGVWANLIPDQSVMERIVSNAAQIGNIPQMISQMAEGDMGTFQQIAESVRAFSEVGPTGPVVEGDIVPPASVDNVVATNAAMETLPAVIEQTSGAMQSLHEETVASGNAFAATEADVKSYTSALPGNTATINENTNAAAGLTEEQSRLGASFMQTIAAGDEMRMTGTDMGVMWGGLGEDVNKVGNAFADGVEGIGGFIGAASMGLSELAAPIWGAQMVGQVIGQLGNSMYQTAEQIEGPMAHSAGTFTGAMDEMRQSANDFGHSFTEAFDNTASPGLQYFADQTKSGAVSAGEFWGGIAGMFTSGTAAIAGFIPTLITSMFPSLQTLGLMGTTGPVGEAPPIMAPPSPPSGLIAGTPGYYDSSGKWVQGTAPAWNVTSQMPGGPPIGEYPVTPVPGPGQFGPFGENRWRYPQTDYFPGQPESMGGGWTWSPTGQPGGCFPAGSLVSTPYGKVAIERLRPGYTVYGCGTDGPVLDKVSKLHKYTDSLFRLTFEDNSTLTLTPGHPVLTKMGWRSLDPWQTMQDDPSLEIAHLIMRDEVYTETGEYLAITGITALLKRVSVYNLTVEHTHMFFVEGKLVHNMAKLSDWPTGPGGEPQVTLSQDGMSAMAAAVCGCGSGTPTGSPQGQGNLLSQFMGGTGSSSAFSVTPQLVGDHNPTFQVSPTLEGNHNPNFTLAPQLDGNHTPNFNVNPMLDGNHSPNFNVNPQLTGNSNPNFNINPQLTGNPSPNFNVNPQLEGNHSPNFNVEPALTGNNRPHMSVEPQLDGDNRPHFSVMPQIEGNNKPSFVVIPDLEGDHNPVFPVNVTVTGNQSMTVPGFASGVEGFGGGVAVVGERGPELMTLERGTNIYPFDKIALGNTPLPMPGGGGWGAQNITHIYLDGRQIATAAAPHIIQQARASTGLRGNL